MGSAVGGVVRAGGATVVTTLRGRSDRTARLAREAGIECLDDLDAVVREAGVVLSVAPPDQAEAIAAAVASAATRTGANPLVADLNAIAPATALGIEASLRAAGLDLVDGSISGPPPRRPGSTRPWPQGRSRDRHRRQWASRSSRRFWTSWRLDSLGLMEQRIEVRRVAVTSVVRYAKPTEISGYFRIVDLEHGRIPFVTPVPESGWRFADPNPRGGTRGTRGVSANGGRLALVNAERLFVFDTSWRLVADFTNRLMSEVHDVLAEERGVWVTATGCDTLLLIGW